MRVDTLPNTKGEKEETSFAGKLLVILIRIFVIPARVTEEGQTKFAFKSWRFFFCWLLWSLPSGTTVFIFYICRIIVPHLNPDSDIPWTNYVTASLFFVFVLAPFLVLPGLGYLVGRSDVQVSSRMAPVCLASLLALWFASVISFYTPCLTGAKECDIMDCTVIAGLCFIFLQIILGPLVLRIYCASFRQQANQLDACPRPDICRTAARLLDVYRSIKLGAGPLLMILYSVTTISIIVMLFQVAMRMTVPEQNILGISVEIYLLYELSRSGQGFHDILRSAASYVR